jgi:predicted HicB family RNase H-like nuclease
MKKRSYNLREPQDVSQLLESWAELSHELFDPAHGLIARTYQSEDERKDLLETDACRTVRKLLASSPDSAGEQPRTRERSSRFYVRLPRSLHAALKREAAREDVSLNQLVVAKLATQLAVVTGKRTRKTREK